MGAPKIDTSGMSDDEVVDLIGEKVSAITGNHNDEKQKVIISSRLQKYMREKKMNSFQEYYSYFLQNEKAELPSLVGLLTTHHTFFFREFVHFEYLKKELPAIVAQAKKEGRRTLRIWSAACSYGHEVYTLAMFFSAHLPSIDPSFDFEILGTDIDESSVARAKNGVFKWVELQKSPTLYLADHWAKGTGDISEFVKAKKSLRNHCEFKPLNLFKIGSDIPRNHYDFIFCRNVFIYFKPADIEMIAGQMMDRLTPSGKLVLGVSESLSNVSVNAKNIGFSIYARNDAPELAKPQDVSSSSDNVVSIAGADKPSASAAPVVAKEARQGPLRVLIVDDSKTVQVVLKKMFTEEYGFTVAGVAENGIEAAKLASEIEFDVMTLDIHMPEMNGVEYMEKHYGKDHPPVVMVTSVAREDGELAIKCFEHGAFDYVQKPNLQNFNDVADELRVKLNCAYEMFRNKDQVHRDLNKQFSRQSLVDDPDSKLQLVISGVSGIDKIRHILENVDKPCPPVLIAFEGPESLKDSLKSKLSSAGKIRDADEDEVCANRFYICSVDELEKYFPVLGKREIVQMVLGDISKKSIGRLSRWNIVGSVVEDLNMELSDHYKSLASKADQVVPYTSFAYEVIKVFLSKGK